MGIIVVEVGGKGNPRYKEQSKQLEYQQDQQENINQQRNQQASNDLFFFSLSIPIHPYHISVMRFHIGMLVAFVATSQLAATAPVPQWNGKNAEAAYVPKSHDSRDHKYRTLT